MIGEAVLAQLVRDLADAVVVADRDGKITFWNDAAERMFGWPTEDAVGQTLDLIIPERLRGRHWEGFRETMATGETKYAGALLEVPALHRDGRQLSIAFTVTLITADDPAHPDAIAAVIRDDTEHWHERRRLRKELEELRAGPA